MAADQLRGLFIDLEVRGVSEATAEIESASQAADSLAGSLRGIVDDGLLAAETLDLTKGRVESLGDELSQTTTKVGALETALTSLSGVELGTLGFTDADVDTSVSSDVGDVGKRTSFELGEDLGDSIANIEDLAEVEGIGQGTVDKIKKSGILGIGDTENLDEANEFLRNWRNFDFPEGGRSERTGLIEGLADLDVKRLTELGSFQFGESDTFESGQDFIDAFSDVDVQGFGSFDEFDIPDTSNIEDVDFDEYGPSFGERAIQQPHLVSEGMGDSQKRALELSRVSEAVEEIGDKTASSTAPTTAFSMAEEKAGDEAGKATPKMWGASRGINAIDEQSEDAASSVSALTSALTGLGASSTYLSVGPLVFSLTNAVAVIGTLLPLVLSLTSALGGLAAGFGSIGAVAGGAFAGGMLGLGERVSQMSSEAETAMEGVGLIMEEFGKAATEAMEPLTTQPFQELSLDVLRGALKLLSTFAQFAANLYKQLEPVINAISSAWWDETPEFFAAIHDAATTLAPEIQEFMTWLAGAVPDAIYFLTDIAKELSPVLSGLGSAFLNLGGSIAEFGVITSKLVLPPLIFLMDIIGDVIGLFNQLPDVVQEGVVAVVLLQRALSGLGASFGVITGLQWAMTASSAQLWALTVKLFGAQRVAAVSTALFQGSLSSLIPTINLTSVSIRGLIASIGPLGWALIGLTGILASFATNAFGVTDALGDFISSLDWLWDIIGGVTSAIGSLLGGFGQFEGLEALLAPIAIPLRIILELLTGLSNAIDAGIDNGIAGPLSVLGESLATVVGIGQDFIDWYNSLGAVGRLGMLIPIAAAFGNIGLAIWTAYEALQFLSGGFGDVASSASGLTSILNPLINVLAGGLQVALDIVSTTVEGLVWGLETLSGVLGTAAGAYKSFTDSIQSGALSFLAPVVNGIAGAIDSLLDAGGRLTELGLGVLFTLWGVNLAMVATNAAVATASTIALTAAQWALNAGTLAVTAAQNLLSATYTAARVVMMAYHGAIWLLSGAYGVLTGATSVNTVAMINNSTAAKAASAAIAAGTAARYALASAYTTLTGAITAATIAEYAFLAPILLVAGALALGLGILYAYTTNMWGLKDAADNVIPQVGKLADLLINGLLNPMDAYKGVIEGFFNPLESLGGLIEWISNLTLPDMRVLGDLFPQLDLPIRILYFLVRLGEKYEWLSGFELSLPTIKLPSISLDGILPSFDGLISDMKSWGVDMVDTFIAGITSFNFGEEISDWLSTIIPFMPSSDAQRGPLSNLSYWGSKIPETIADGILSSADVIAGAVKSAVQDAIDVGQGLIQGAEDLWNWETPDMGRISMPNIPDIGGALSGMNPFSGPILPQGGMGPILPQNGLMGNLGGMIGNLGGMGDALLSPTPSPAPVGEPSVQNNKTNEGNTIFDINLEQAFDNTFGSDNPQQNRREMENMSQNEPIKALVSALQGHNDQ